MKTIYKVSLGLISTGLLYGYIKTNNSLKAIKQLKTKISRIHGIDVSLKNLKLNLDFALQNLTNTNINISSFGLINIKEIRFYNKQTNSFIGSATSVINGIEIPAKTIFYLKNIQTEIPVLGLLSNLSLFTAGNPEENLKIVLLVEALGKEYQLTSED